MNQDVRPDARATITAAAYGATVISLVVVVVVIIASTGPGKRLPWPVSPALIWLGVAAALIYLATWVPQYGPERYFLAAFWPTSLLILALGTAVVIVLLAARLALRWLVRGLDVMFVRLTRRLVQADETGKLYRYLSRSGDRVELFVEVRDSTGVHHLRVPPQTRTAREGVAWTYGLQADQYHPTVRT